MNDLETNILEHLHGMDPQTVCAVAVAVKAHPTTTRQALYNLEAAGDVLMTTNSHGAELFEAAHGGYLPPEAA